MVETKQNKPTASKIVEKLGTADSGRQAAANVTTHPTRTITHTYERGFQASKNDEVKQ